MNGGVGCAIIAQRVKIAFQPLLLSIKANWEFSSNCGLLSALQNVFGPFRQSNMHVAAGANLICDKNVMGWISMVFTSNEWCNPGKKIMGIAWLLPAYLANPFTAMKTGLPCFHILTGKSCFDYINPVCALFYLAVLLIQSSSMPIQSSSMIVKLDLIGFGITQKNPKGLPYIFSFPWFGPFIRGRNHWDPCP